MESEKDIVESLAPVNEMHMWIFYKYMSVFDFVCQDE